MHTRTRLRRGIISGGSGIALAGLVLATTAAASAAASPSVTVKPSSGLASTAKVAVAVAGFTVKDKVAVSECAAPNSKTIVCDVSTAKSVTTNGSGGGKTSLTVHSKFRGLDQAGHQRTVNCGKANQNCFVGAGDASNAFATAAITFTS